MSMASRPHSIPYQAAQSVLSAYKDYDGPWYKDDLPKVMEAACVMAQHTLDLVEQFEALRAAAEVVAGSPFGAEVRGLPELRVLLASNPANVQGAPSPANGDAETSGTSGRPAPSPAKSRCPATEPCECGRPTSVCQFSCDFCTGGDPMSDAHNTPSCPKCGTDDVLVRWHDRKKRGDYFEPCERERSATSRRPVSDKEHLHYHCRRCQYDWIGPTLAEVAA